MWAAKDTNLRNDHFELPVLHTSKGWAAGSAQPKGGPAASSSQLSAKDLRQIKNELRNEIRLEFKWGDDQDKGKGKGKGRRTPSVPRRTQKQVKTDDKVLKYWGKAQICQDFNKRRGCRFNAKCKFLHRCNLCGSTDHPAMECDQ